MTRKRLASWLAAIGVVSAACTVGGGGGTPSLPTPPTAGLRPPTSVGAGEGQLNLITWEGYTEDSWAQEFVQRTGCRINSRFVGSTAEMMRLMADGGAGQWDMVSAPGDISLSLVYDGDVRPMNTALVPEWSDFFSAFKSPDFNTVAGIHYGISVQWSPNLLLFNTRKFSPAPSSWSAIYDPAHSGEITVPDNPMQIADAALYLAHSQPATEIKNPFELSRRQFDAAVSLLTQQRQLVHAYWPIASAEISMFQDGTVVVASAPPYQAIQLATAGIPVAETLPSEGATGWVDSWMLATKAPHPNCSYMWAAYTTTAQVQARQALFFGETPVNVTACGEMNRLQAGSCTTYHADATDAYLSRISFWRTPRAECGANAACVPYDEWLSAWTAIRA